MKRALLFLLLTFSLTGCAVRVYHPDPYYRYHEHWRDDRWR